ncbi:MAG: phosphodiester glycosidase family protein [Clostridia bacterium]|nr:phosphodiester glycosidase family protein [Clostridia bacterium]
MKKIFVFLLTLLLTLCLLSGTAEDEELRQAYEQDVVRVMRAMSYYATNEYYKQTITKYIITDSPAWNTLDRYDYGWCRNIRKNDLNEVKTENDVKTAEDTIECDFYCYNDIEYEAWNYKARYEMRYHVTLKYYSYQGKEDLFLYDFYNLPSEAEALKAEGFNSKIDEGMHLSSISGRTYRGYVLVVDDPSRVKAGAIKWFNNSGGWKLDKFYEEFHGAATINGGAFMDGSSHKGGIPEGYVMTDGVLRRKNEYRNVNAYVVMGFDYDNKLHVGRFKDDELEALHLRDALAFQTALIINGERQEIIQNHISHPYSARTGIGQDADGKVYFLIVEGRDAGSLGCSVDDMVDIYAELGCVDAGTLDGGYSTTLLLGSEGVYTSYHYGISRAMPTVFYVKQLGDQ